MAGKVKSIKKDEIVKEVVVKLMTLLGIEVKVDVSEGDDNCLNVKLTSDEATGLLIGRHGENLGALELILGLIVRQKLGEWVRVVVNVGDWKEKQEDYLKNLANQVAQRVLQTGEPQPIYNLSAAQRRIIHLELANNPSLETESIGEGNDRYMIVKPKG
jgi:spoIIIJ-associated protein